MTGIITPGPLSGTLERVISSKSQAHRMLICAALSDGPTLLRHVPPSRDAEATCRCLEALGTGLRRTGEDLEVTPAASGRQGGGIPLLDCGESGSTLRFLLPVAAALGADCAFTGEGRLSSRPLEPLYSELVSHGAELSAPGAFPLRCGGKLRAGRYTLAGNVSSQFISGLLLALPLPEGDSEIRITGPLESEPYVEMTLQALRRFGIRWERAEEPAGSVFRVPGGQRYHSPGEADVEADWSGAAFFLAAGALSPRGVTCPGLNPASAQGDRAILDLLRAFGAEVTTAGGAVTCRRGPLRGIDLDAADIPDLVPVVAAVAAHARGDTRIRRIQRLRLKESDRVQSVLSMIRSLGGRAEADASEMVIRGLGGLPGGRVDSFRDHRIVMAAAVAACAASGPSVISDIEAADKSWPGFFDRWQALGGLVRISDRAGVE